MSVLTRPTAVIAALAVTVALALGACGSTNSQVQTVGTAHAVIGFAAHAGLAFGAFKLFILNPYHEGKLGLTHPIKDAEAAAAAVFALHELKVARSELVGHPHLARLIGVFGAVELAMSLLHSHLLHGSTAGISGAQSRISTAGSQASAAGSPIHAVTGGLHL
ncbi:MAG TPA: hypothetical protein VFN48_05780 [Solirubrobacteraceae bacterium]|nr:hypothetical protein [Solirubrobacteraceae bacterium]